MTWNTDAEAAPTAISRCLTSTPATEIKKDTALEQIGNNALVEEIARGLHHDLDAAAPRILCGETLDDHVRDLGA